MVDKQIIIDGVDVSGCSLYEDNPKYRMWGTCDCMRTMIDQSGYDELAGAECKGHNCYYKQLKRKEQECERLKHDNDYEVGALERTIDNLKAENEELKQQNNQLDNGINEQFSKIVELEGRNNLLKVTLTEIKEIGKKSMREGKMLSGGWLYQFIEQKINEVESE